uniref:Uncharacterized protein n=1 Tax=Solanum lycopersicum TaxID=4081 RepID=A0A3Q7FVG2_SOLLC
MSDLYKAFTFACNGSIVTAQPNPSKFTLPVPQFFFFKEKGLVSGQLSRPTGKPIEMGVAGHSGADIVVCPGQYLFRAATDISIRVHAVNFFGLRPQYSSQ